MNSVTFVSLENLKSLGWQTDTGESELCTVLGKCEPDIQRSCGNAFQFWQPVADSLGSLSSTALHARRWRHQDGPFSA